MKKTRICAAVFAALLLCVAACTVYVHDVKKHSSLYLAALRNNVVETWLLIQFGEDVNEEFEHNAETALMEAAHNNAAAVARLLIKSGADVNAKGFLYDTALMITVTAESPDVAKLLIEAGADVNAKNHFGSTALWKAIGKSAVDMVQLLIEAGADVNATDNVEVSHLMFATERAAVLSGLLVKSSADANASNSHSKTAYISEKYDNALAIVRLSSRLART